jgi:hypothetical protein
MNTILTLAHIKPHRTVIKDWFFKKEDASIAGRATQEMLGPLINKVPTQVRETNEIKLLQRHTCSVGTISSTHVSVAHANSLFIIVTLKAHHSPTVGLILFYAISEITHNFTPSISNAVVTTAQTFASAALFTTTAKIDSISRPIDDC